MEEPKRRARGVQQAQPEARQDMPEKPAATQSALPRRRRTQQSLIQEQTEGTQHAGARQMETARRAGGGHGRKIMQALLGAAALLAMAGAAALHAAKRMGTACSRLAGRLRTKRPGGMHPQKGECLRLAAMALCTCVAIVSAWQVGSIVLRSMRTKSLNASLAQQREAAMQERQEPREIEETGAPLAGFAPADEAPAVDEPQPTETQPETDDPQPAATAAPDVVKTTKYRQVGGDALPEMAQLHAQNHDLVA